MFLLSSNLIFLYFKYYGLTENEITKFKTRSFQGTENGNTRWVICINDFVLGERVRIYPGCDHIFHLKCSQLWLEIEGIWPVCSNTPKDLSSSSLNNSLNPMNDQMVLIMDILNANNLNHQNIQQVAINNGDAEFNRRQNENFNDDNNNLREPLLGNINH